MATQVGLALLVTGGEVTAGLPGPPVVALECTLVSVGWAAQGPRVGLGRGPTPQSSSGLLEERRGGGGQ